MDAKAAGLAGVALTLLALPFFAGHASAHHSFAIFDQSQVLTRTGTVDEFEWINPHAWLHMTIVDEAGNATKWAFEGGSTAQLTQLGWSPAMFETVPEVEIGFRPMRDGSRGGQLMRVTLPDGTQVCSNRGCN